MNQHESCEPDKPDYGGNLILHKRFPLSFTLLIVLSLALIHSATAQQTDIVLNCNDGRNFNNLHSLHVRNASPDETLFYTTLALETEHDAILGIRRGNEDTYCNDGDDIALAYEGTLPTLDNIQPSALNATDFISNSSDHTVSYGDYNGRQGNFVLVAEGMRLDGQADQYQIAITPALYDLAPTIRVYVLASADLFATLAPESGMGMTVSNRDEDEQSNILLRCDEQDRSLCLDSEGLAFSTFDAQYTADDIQSALQINLAEQPLADLDIMISHPNLQDATAEVTYTIVIHVDSRLTTQAPIATTTANDDGSVTMVCDDTRITDQAVQFGLPQTPGTLEDGAYRVTAITAPSAQTFLATFNVPDGICHLPANRDLDWQIGLPFLNASASSDNAQASLDAGLQGVVAWQSLPDDDNAFNGNVVLIIEGGNINGNSQDVYAITVTQAMVDNERILGVMMIALSDLDGALALVDDQGAIRVAGEQSIVCNDAGFEDCYGEATTLDEGTITLDGETWFALVRDASLELQMSDYEAGETLFFRASNARDFMNDDNPLPEENASGAYLMIITFNDETP